MRVCEYAHILIRYEGIGFQIYLTQIIALIYVCVRQLLFSSFSLLLWRLLPCKDMQLRVYRVYNNVLRPSNEHH